MNNLFNLKLLKRKLDSFTLDDEKLKKASDIISNWRSRLVSGELDKQNEKMLQGDFLKDFFQTILDYPSSTSTQGNYNFLQHPKTDSDKKREPDGSLGFFGNIRLTKAVIELKGSKSDLDKKQNRAENLSAVEQAFFYISKFDSCDWVIVSNFKEIRLYSKERGQGFYHTFNLLDLTSEKQQLKMFYFLLCKDNLISETKSSFVFDLMKETTSREKEISEKFYLTYKEVRRKLFDHIAKNNPEIEKGRAFLKTQKLLDRFIFICFCQSSNNLLPKGIILDTYKIGKASRRRSERKIWDEFKNLFLDIDQGRHDIDPKINKYNGGLFSKDEELDNLNINDNIWSDVIEISNYDFETDLTVNILGHIFEQSISDLEEIRKNLINNESLVDNNTSKRKKDSIFYTPTFITDYIIKNTVGSFIEEKPDRLENITILDPACGSGAFLNQAHDFLVKEYDKRLITQVEKKHLEKKKTKYQLDFSDQEKALSQKKALLNNIYGIDLNDESVEITRLSLWLKTADRGEELVNLDKNIMVGNSLISDADFSDKYFDWHTLKTVKNGGFDVIVGNPPYLNIQGLTAFHNKDAEFFSQNYDSAKGKYDIYILFLEKAFNLLKEGGSLGFIIPHKFINADFGTGIRKFLKKHQCVEKIISFGENLIFKDAITYTALVFLKKEKLDKILYYEVKGSKTNQEIETEINQLTDSHFASILFASLEDKKWIFSSAGNKSVLEKLNKQPLRLKDVFSNIFQGIITTNDDIFVLKGEFKGNHFIGFSKALNKEIILEKNIMKPLLKGEDVNRYMYLSENNYVIYPHFIQETKTKTYEEAFLKNEFPMAYEYLNDFKEKLSETKIKWKTNPKYWYSLHNSRDILNFTQSKIITKQISLGSNISYDNEGLYFNSMCCGLIKKAETKEDYKYFLTILNSSLLWFFIKNTGDILSGGYFRYKNKYLKPFPIPKLENLDHQKPFIEKADQLIELTNQFHDTKEIFTEWLITNFKMEKSKSKFNDVHKMTKEKLLDTLKLAKADLSDILLYSNLIKNHSNLIKTYLDLQSLEQEANYMVYKLYGLNNEDIRIIEEDILR